MHPAVTASSAATPELSPCCRLFAAVDGLRITSRFRTWTVQVQGVHAEADVYWLQVAPDDAPHWSVVVRLRDTAPIEHLVSTLQTVHFGDRRAARVLHVG